MVPTPELTFPVPYVIYMHEPVYQCEGSEHLYTKYSLTGTLALLFVRCMFAILNLENSSQVSFLKRYIFKYLVIFHQSVANHYRPIYYTTIDDSRMSWFLLNPHQSNTMLIE